MPLTSLIDPGVFQNFWADILWYFMDLQQPKQNSSANSKDSYWTVYYVGQHCLGEISRLGVGDSVLGSSSSTVRRSSQSRLLCFVLTEIAKIATRHRELLPWARVSLGKVGLVSWIIRVSLTGVWKRARDYLGLMNESREQSIGAREERR
ncbi:hypothetical protein L6452_17916 [Arctium lappa]|uniref:Uncharacterized protein n=1 Tax=Arctium lappa TaxID=4217 RepID=A0ACB9C4R8_ARCLA|nr:hypothetical protein L6452_17916 [Arctium lappa]